MSFVTLFLITFALATVLTLTATRILLPILARHHVGQRILEIGPAWHSAKNGTPTMGGLAFVLAATLALLTTGGLLASNLPALFWRPLLLSTLYALSGAAVGIVDDMTKFRRKQNEGLTPGQKLILQTAFALAYLLLLRLYGHIDTSVYLPYFNRVLDIGILFYPLSVLLCVWLVNCVNLTDGVDGLAAGTSFIYAAFFVIAAAYLREATALIFAAAMMGISFGFLFYNRHPARLFMGDTGSLFLGGMAVGCGFLSDLPALAPIVGGVFVLEGISVVLQVLYYKLTGKRLFLMAPLHHHLEKRGFSERRIVLLLSLLGILLALLAAPGVL